MTRNNIGLWVSLIALIALIASCGGGISAPAADDLAAANAEGQLPADDADLDLIGAPWSSEGDKGVSFTPGLACAIAAGDSFPSILRYGWRSGLVSEGAAPNWVKLRTTDVNKPAWIIYRYEEFVPGRLKSIKIWGASRQLKVEVFNWSTGAWTSLGSYDLNAGAIALGVPPEASGGGTTVVRMSQILINTVRIDKIETSVW